MPHGVLDSKFKLYSFILDVPIEGEIEKTSGQYLGLIVMVIDISWFEFKSGIFIGLYLYLCSCEELRLLVS
jgi:hypothetical protein